MGVILPVHLDYFYLLSIKLNFECAYWFLIPRNHVLILWIVKLLIAGVSQWIPFLFVVFLLEEFGWSVRLVPVSNLVIGVISTHGPDVRWFISLNVSIASHFANFIVEQKLLGLNKRWSLVVVWESSHSKRWFSSLMTFFVFGAVLLIRSDLLRSSVIGIWSAFKPTRVLGESWRPVLYWLVLEVLLMNWWTVTLWWLLVWQSIRFYFMHWVI